VLSQRSALLLSPRGMPRWPQQLVPQLMPVMLGGVAMQQQQVVPVSEL
jgi:hypothetical protein